MKNYFILTAKNRFTFVCFRKTRWHKLHPNMRYLVHLYYFPTLIVPFISEMEISVLLIDFNISLEMLLRRIWSHIKSKSSVKCFFKIYIRYKSNFRKRRVTTFHYHNHVTTIKSFFSFPFEHFFFKNPCDSVNLFLTIYW